MTNPFYPDPERGKRLKAIRQHLGKSLGDINEETGISRSYLSDFERGTKLPTGKYLQYLFDSCNINLNYIYGTSQEMLRENTVEVFDFGKYQDEVDKMLSAMNACPHTLFAMLGYFAEYEMKFADLLRDFLSKNKKRS